MKRKEFEELKKKPIVELEKYLQEAREHLRVLKFDLAAGKVKNVRGIRLQKRNIAQVSTMIHQEQNK